MYANLDQNSREFAEASNYLKNMIEERKAKTPITGQQAEVFENIMQVIRCSNYLVNSYYAYFIAYNGAEPAEDLKAVRSELRKAKELLVMNGLIRNLNEIII